MNKTLSIGLAGFSFVIEEHAYIKLSDYLAALRSSLDASEADEVMHDIEIRIVEILKDTMAKREVVNDEDIEKVIAQIGKPEVIEEQEEAYFSDKTSTKKTRTSFSNGNQKQLFRDPENLKIGGVCSGLAQYFGMDITWMRVIWFGIAFLGLFTAGISTTLVVLIYIILWIVLPKAQTATDFLKMKGKPLNFDNLKEESSNIVKFANESTAKVGEMYNEAKPYVKSTGNGLWDFLRIILGGIFALIAFSAFIGTFFIFGLVGNPDIPGMNEFSFYFEEDGLDWILKTIMLLGALIPALLFSLLSIKLLSPKTKLRNVGYVIGGLFVALLLLGAYFGFNMAKKDLFYKGNNQDTEEIAINTTSDSILVDIKKVNIPQNFTAYDDDIFSDKKDVYEEDYIYVDVVRKTNIKTPYLVLKKEAKGYNVPLELQVPVEIIDNKIMFPNFIKYPYKNRFRDYQLNYELVVPQNMKVIKLKDFDINGDLDANGMNDEDDNQDNQDGNISIQKNKININGTTIEYSSGDKDSVIINGKKYPKKVADSIIEHDIKDINSLKDLKNLKDVNISIKDGDSKIEINTKK